VFTRAHFSNCPTHSAMSYHPIIPVVRPGRLVLLDDFGEEFDGFYEPVLDEDGWISWMCVPTPRASAPSPPLGEIPPLEPLTPPPILPPIQHRRKRRRRDVSPIPIEASDFNPIAARLADRAAAPRDVALSYDVEPLSFDVFGGDFARPARGSFIVSADEEPISD
jgi:hypothetical protein